VKNNKEGVDHPRLRVNFLSIAGPEVWTVAFTGPFPYQMALDPEGPNAKMSRELQERGVVSAGILIMDFPGHRLIQNIINSNHFKQEL
jgi:hypothetical protein